MKSRVTPTLIDVSLTLIAASITLLATSFMFNVGCEPHTDPLALATLGQARPQAIIYLDDETLAVTDVAYRGGVWGEGRVVFLNPETGVRYGARFTPTENPQRIRAHRDQLTLISSGPIDLSGAPRGEESTLSLLSRTHPLGRAPELTWRATPRGAFAIDVVTTDTSHLNTSPPERAYEDHEHFMTSGLDGVLWRAQLPNSEDQPIEAEGTSTLEALRYASLDELSLGAVTRWREYTLIIDFNSDRLHVIDARGERSPCAPELGRTAGVMEGAQTPYISGDRLWLSFGLSGRLIEVDLSALDLSDASCEPSIIPYTPALGQVPNDLIVTERSVYILHSAESAIWRYSRESRTRDAIWPIPPQTNPWHFAMSPDQSALAVSEWARGGITLISASDGALIRQLDPSALAPPVHPSCSWSDEQLTQSRGGPWRISADEPLKLHWSTAPPAQHAARALDLQGATQLALALAPSSGPPRVEARLGADTAWVEISAERLGGLKWRAEVDVSALEIGAQRSFEIERDPIIVQETHTQERDRDTGELTGEFTTRVSAGELSPCDLFEPSIARRYGVSRLDLSALTPRAESAEGSEGSEGVTLWGGAHPEAGHVELTELKITALDPDRPVELTAVAYRRWAR